MWTLRHPPAWLLLTLALAAPLEAGAELDITDSGSPKNRERGYRSSTRFIILHTTEGEKKGALAKLRHAGEAHYLVDRQGRVTRIVERDRIARHAGRSMWSGIEALDHHSVGIEIVGYHDRPLQAAQLRALKELIAQLKSRYRVPDERVLTHSMVAYGTPNRYHRRPHRGRKRCGMNLTSPAVRAALGLSPLPSADPDVRSGRLVVADRALARHIYGRAQERPARSRRPARGSERNDALYVLPGGRVVEHAELMASAQGRRTLARLPSGTKVLHGYRNAGRISARRPPSVVCGPRWRHPSTLYRLPGGKLVPGDRVRATHLPKGTVVLIRRSL